MLIGPYLSKAVAIIDAQLKLLKWKKPCTNNCTKTVQPQHRKQGINWTGTITDLVEFAYAALESKVFNDGDLEIKELIQDLCGKFNIEVKDCYRTFIDIRRRTGSRTLFLDKMTEKINARMNQKDE